MRNQTYAYKLVLQIFAQVVILNFIDTVIDRTLPVQDMNVTSLTFCFKNSD